MTYRIRFWKPIALAVLLFTSFSCNTESESSDDKAIEEALNSINAEDLKKHIGVLASDEFEGRLPATKGGQLTLDYLEKAFKEIGCEPGNNGSFFQEVPLVGINATEVSTLTITGEGSRQSYEFGSEFMATTSRVVEESGIVNSDMIFVGYGVVAPEYDWNDYEGLDVKGKTVLMLVNDPGFATQDSNLFNGNTMTYYGRWTYKFEEAARQGAEAAFVIHETKAASYPWAVVEKGWSGVQYHTEAANGNMDRCAIEGWLSWEAAETIFQQSGMDFGEWFKKAETREFEPQLMSLQATVDLKNSIEKTKSSNVIAMIPGSKRPDEYIIYTAHWDHLGRDTTKEGDQIYNGAADNASGTAGLIELAEAFMKLETKPERSIILMPVTAEEQGLLGSRFYSENPVFPAKNTVAVINTDVLNYFGETKDITIVGKGNSQLDDYLKAAAEKEGRYVRPDPKPEAGGFYRSDHFSFAKIGIPALYPKVGIDHKEKGEEYGKAQVEKYTAERYHKPSDELTDDWDFSGAVKDVRLIFRVGYELANTEEWPNWNKGTEFRARRDADRK